MEQLLKLPNIGEELAKKLIAVGIKSHDELAKIGSAEAVLMIGEKDMSTCVNMLFAFEGAIQKIRWHVIPKEERKIIKETFYSLMEKK